MSRLTPLVAITNESTVLTDAEVKNAMIAFQNAVHYHFRVFWNETASIGFYTPTTVPADAWRIVILDDSDMAGALGYHDWQPGELPSAKVFAKTDAQYGLSWSVTLTHELFEMLADPYIARAEQTSNTEFYALEVGDPVEADQYAKKYRGADGLATVLISDFVTPAWFASGAPQPYDLFGHATSPLQLLPGGYVSIFVSGKGWKQFTAQKDGQLIEVERDKSDPRFRDRG